MILLYIIIAVFLFLAGYAIGSIEKDKMSTNKGGLIESAGAGIETASTLKTNNEDINSVEMENAFTLLLGYNADMAYGVKKA
jgi:hypothetical protein